MELFFSLFTLLTLIDLMSVIKGKVKKDIIVYTILSIAVFLFAMFYYSDVNRTSLISLINKFLNIKVK